MFFFTYQCCLLIAAKGGSSFPRSGRPSLLDAARLRVLTCPATPAGH
ncbi:hypothetical protein KIS4809_4150 [Bacillus sp. ZZV12-4809]|nr:hypothetical protein KIS4809_4150 [Bacillus sp. ZZV12-4809]